MFRLILVLLAAAVMGCVAANELTAEQSANPPSDCYVESGWLDASNGCSGPGRAIQIASTCVPKRA